MRTSESIIDIADALAKAQAEIRHPARNKVNLGYKNNGKPSKYADLAAVIDAIKPAFTKHGLSFVQFPLSCDKVDSVGICTRLMHSSGQWVEGSYFVPASKVDPQGFGSAITYARRQSLAAMAGVASEDDDDADAASKPAPKPLSAEEQQAVTAGLERLSETKNMDDLVDVWKQIWAASSQSVRDALTDYKNQRKADFLAVEA